MELSPPNKGTVWLGRFVASCECPEQGQESRRLAVGDLYLHASGQGPITVESEPGIPIGQATQASG